MVDRGTAPAASLGQSWRGPILEGQLRGHVAVVDGSGSLVAWAGDPWHRTSLRSASKPFQASSFIESGTWHNLGLETRSLAIATASHHGEPGHIEAVLGILGAAGIDPAALRCGTHLPSDPAAAAALLRSQAPVTALYNNCSGKHAAMLAVCRQRDWPLESYQDRAHPLQMEIARRLAAHAGVDAESMPWGIDGCGLPTFELSLFEFARALAHAAAQDPSFRSCQAAMAEHPWLVAGTGAFDTLLMGCVGDSLTSKSGAAGIWGAVARDGHLAVVAKLESGSALGMPQVALRALQQAGLVEPRLFPELQALPEGQLSNWAGTTVGRISSDFSLNS